MHPLTFAIAAWGLFVTLAASLRLFSFFVATIHYAATDYMQSFESALIGLLATMLQYDHLWPLVEAVLVGLGWFAVAAIVEYLIRIQREIRRVGAANLRGRAPL